MIATMTAENAVASGSCSGVPPYASLLERTRQLIEPLDLTEVDGGKKWEQIAGRTCLQGELWRLGEIAEARFARVYGGGIDALIAVILPARPGTTPVLTAEMYASHGTTRHFCVDLQAPGFPTTRRHELAETTTALSVRHAMYLPREDKIPGWVVDDSAGGFLFARGCSLDLQPRLAQAYEDYLNLWLDFAYSPLDPAGTVVEATATFCHRQTRRDWFLDELFGIAWSRRFLKEFLFRCH